jgi:penicillin-binding protein 1A
MKRHIRSESKSDSVKIKKTAPRSAIKTLVFGFLVFMVVGIVFIFYLAQDLPSLKQLEHYDPELVTKIYSRDGVLIKELFTKKRMLKPLEEMPDYLIQAILASEDREFNDHWGLNIKRIMKVIMIDIIQLRYAQGASTITQQVARQLYLTLEKSITRKLREIITAIQIERTYTKPEILEMYLNHMYLGHGAYGVQTAARKFFDKDVSLLNLEECALLTGLFQLPNVYSPFRHPERAKRRRNVVLYNMFTQGIISEDEFQQAKQKPILLRKQNKFEEFGIAPYFTEYLRQNLQDTYHMDLYTGGYSIYTPLDSRLQACADSAVAKHLTKLQDNFNKKLIRTGKIKRYLPDSLLQKHSFSKLKTDHAALLDSIATAKFTIQVAFIALEPTTGKVLALVGGRDFEESKYNRALQMRTRQPGSTFKPIAYTAAIDNGYSPCFELLNQPAPLILPNGERWSPHNYDLSLSGLTSLRDGLKKSLNLITVRLVQQIVPPKTIVDYARKLGLTTNIPAFDAIALGSGSVSPIEMTSAFGVFANQGVLAKPIFVSQVVDKYDNIIEEHQPEIREVLRKETAYIMTDMLQGVVNHGTGVTARTVYNFYHPAAGKTGTTNDFTDAWFIGFTKDIVAGVWVGFDDPAKTLGSGQAGAVVALPIWAQFMKAAHDTLNLPHRSFKMPSGVVRVDICKETKLLATESCPTIISEIFETKNAPTDFCDKHTGYIDNNRNKKTRTRF